MESYDTEKRTQEADGELVFHYKRGSFRERESSFHRDLASGKSFPKKGFMKALFAKKGNKITFASMMACAALVLILAAFKEPADEASISGVNAKISAFLFDSSIYVKVDFSPQDKAAEPFPVNLDVSIECLTPQGQVADRRETFVVFDPTSPQPLNLVFTDYDYTLVRCILKTDTQSANLECKIRK